MLEHAGGYRLALVSGALAAILAFSAEPAVAEDRGGGGQVHRGGGGGHYGGGHGHHGGGGYHGGGHGHHGGYSHHHGGYGRYYGGGLGGYYGGPGYGGLGLGYSGFAGGYSGFGFGVLRYNFPSYVGGYGLSDYGLSYGVDPFLPQSRYGLYAVPSYGYVVPSYGYAAPPVARYSLPREPGALPYSAMSPAKVDPSDPNTVLRPGMILPDGSRVISVDPVK